MMDYRDRPPVDQPPPSWREVLQDIGLIDFAATVALAIVFTVVAYAFAVVAGCVS